MKPDFLEEAIRCKEALNSLKHAIREAMARIEAEKCDLSSGNNSCCEILHNKSFQRAWDILRECCGGFL